MSHLGPFMSGSRAALSLPVLVLFDEIYEMTFPFFANNTWCLRGEKKFGESFKFIFTEIVKIVNFDGVSSFLAEEPGNETRIL